VGEIRTHGTLTGSAVFKTAALNHSATTPGSLKGPTSPTVNASGHSSAPVAPALHCLPENRRCLDRIQLPEEPATCCLTRIQLPEKPAVYCLNRIRFPEKSTVYCLSRIQLPEKSAVYCFKRIQLPEKSAVYCLNRIQLPVRSAACCFGWIRKSVAENRSCLNRIRKGVAGDREGLRLTLDSVQSVGALSPTELLLLLSEQTPCVSSFSLQS
jgi:hypothetical protein